MKKTRGLFVAFVPLMLTFSVYLTYSEKISTKPSDAGFWMILALGMGVGIAVNRFVWWMRYNKYIKELKKVKEN